MPPDDDKNCLTNTNTDANILTLCERCKDGEGRIVPKLEGSCLPSCFD
jgi:hypothetical protein